MTITPNPVANVEATSLRPTCDGWLSRTPLMHRALLDFTYPISKLAAAAFGTRRAEMVFSVQVNSFATLHCPSPAQLLAKIPLSLYCKGCPDL
jgi:hypothetical protein